MDKHLLAENPMRSPKGGLCIIRIFQPISIYEVIEGHVKASGIVKEYYYNGLNGETEHFTLRYHHYFTIDIDTINESKVLKFMDDAWHWYAACLRWKEQNKNI
jgi:hypothetical protein